MRDAVTPADRDSGHGLKLPTWCEGPPMTACCVDIPQSPTPQDFLCKVRNAGTPAGNDSNDVKTPARCETPPATGCPNIPQLSTPQHSDNRLSVKRRVQQVMVRGVTL